MPAVQKDGSINVNVGHTKLSETVVSLMRSIWPAIFDSNRWKASILDEWRSGLQFAQLLICSAKKGTTQLSLFFLLTC